MARATSPKVMAMVEEELKKNPAVKNQALYERAKKLDPAIARLDSRQFHARYPLQVKRRLAPARRGRRRGRAAAARAARGNRGGVRSVLVQLARDAAAAAQKGAAEVVDVIEGLDRYVDRVLKAAGRR